jgi:hypothetical protein
MGRGIMKTYTPYFAGILDYEGTQNDIHDNVGDAAGIADFPLVAVLLATSVAVPYKVKRGKKSRHKNSWIFI